MWRLVLVVILEKIMQSTMLILKVNDGKNVYSVIKRNKDITVSVN